MVSNADCWDFRRCNQRTDPVHLAATMLVHGITRLLTQNEKDFRRYLPLIEILPLVPAVNP